jgi:hypothetical protein
VSSNIPLTCTITEEELQNLHAIFEASKILCVAVTARMTAEFPDGKRVWDMFNAHGEALKAVSRHENAQYWSVK